MDKRIQIVEKNTKHYRTAIFSLNVAYKKWSNTLQFSYEQPTIDKKFSLGTLSEEFKVRAVKNYEFENEHRFLIGQLRMINSSKIQSERYNERTI